ncbi:alpha-ketoglutarate-dependent dioxygenase alkB homolog 4 [Lampetra fluviatilis]
MEAAVPCACKGVRTCLACESDDKRRRHNNNRHNNDNNRHNNNNNDNNRSDDDSCRELVLEFDPALGLAVVPPGSPLAGMAARVSGVHVWRDFLSPDEEQELVVAIDRDEWRPSQSGRRKQDYGPKVNFRKRRVRAAGFSGLPPLSRALALRVRAASPALLGDFVPVEQCHLEYEPSRGSSIDAHLDDAWLWGDRLVTVNLLSDTALTLTRPAGRAGGVTVRVPSPRRSLVLLRGAARRSWLHAVRRGDVAARRVCITLRELSAEFRPEPRALALLADEALAPEGTARMDRAEPEEAAAASAMTTMTTGMTTTMPTATTMEFGELRSRRSAEIGARLLATALTFRGIPVL